MKQDILTDTENEKILEEVKQEIEEAIQSAKAAPNPPLQWMFEDIYKDKTWNLKEQEEEVRKLYGEVSHD
jgi:TPP-dependent pyruvate/acetoin dehydrogenase alpha subunit